MANWESTKTCKVIIPFPAPFSPASPASPASFPSSFAALLAHSHTHDTPQRRQDDLLANLWLLISTNKARIAAVLPRCQQQGRVDLGKQQGATAGAGGEAQRLGLEKNDSSMICSFSSFSTSKPLSIIFFQHFLIAGWERRVVFCRQ